MKKLILTAALLAAATPTWAQVFEPGAPVAAGSTTTVKGNSITLQLTRFNWSAFKAAGGQSFSASTQGLIAGDFLVAKRVTVGGWLAKDKQSVDALVSSGGGGTGGAANTGTMGTTVHGNADSNWGEAYVGYRFYQDEKYTAGVDIGRLEDSIDESYANGDHYKEVVNWNELYFTGSVALGETADKPAPWVVGATLGYLSGAGGNQTSISPVAPPAHIATSSGISYGVSAAYSINPSWSLNTAIFAISPQHRGTISRLNAGVGFHF